MSGTTQSHVYETAEPRETLRWRIWPLRDEGPRGWLVPAAAAAVCAVVGWSAGWPWAAIAAGVQAVALWGYLLPATYELSPQGVERRVGRLRRRFPWRAVRRCEAGAGGLWLHSSASERPIDQLSGLFLPWGSRPGAVTAAVQYYLRNAV